MVSRFEHGLTARAGIFPSAWRSGAARAPRAYPTATQCAGTTSPSATGAPSSIVTSDRRWAYAHLPLARRQLCWEHLQRDFQAHAEGLAAECEFGLAGLALRERVFWACPCWRWYQRAVPPARRHPGGRRGCAPTASRAQPAASGQRRPGHPFQELSPRSPPTLRAAYALGAVLDHLDRDRRHLRDLMARGGTRRAPLLGLENTSAAAVPGPMLDHLIHCAGRQQLAPAALVAWLGSRRAPRAILAPPGA